jgi:hypothetical protein
MTLVIAIQRFPRRPPSLYCCARNILTLHRETLTQYITLHLKRGGEVESLYSCTLESCNCDVLHRRLGVDKWQNPRGRDLYYILHLSGYCYTVHGANSTFNTVCFKWSNVTISDFTRYLKTAIELYEFVLFHISVKSGLSPICKPFEKPWIRFPVWRNRFPDSRNVYKYGLCFLSIIFANSYASWVHCFRRFSANFLEISRVVFPHKCTLGYPELTHSSECFPKPKTTRFKTPRVLQANFGLCLHAGERML